MPLALRPPGGARLLLPSQLQRRRVPRGQHHPSILQFFHHLEQTPPRIFSWNINGTSPFLQPSITSFFKAPKDGSKEDSKDETYLASLRIFLHRQQWPSIIFLQEVKIASKDIKTQDAVKTAINTHLPSETSSNTSKDSLYDAHFTLPTNSHNARGPWRSGKLYGVCSILRRNLNDMYTTAVQTVD